jgi:histidinol-phosphate phosphatase family protein
MSGASPSFDVVVPTVGRRSLSRLLDALAAGPPPGRLLIVDDRRDASVTLLPEALARWGDRVEILRGACAGPAAARNTGWRASRAGWVAFLDDDVVPGADWARRLAGEIAAAGPRVAGIQGRIDVPLPSGRRPTDWERNVAGLAGARWATADMAFRRAALAGAGGFDERFPRAYREDADLALRLLDAGWTLARGDRGVLHPVGPAGALKSVRLQAGNADDALMDRLHGRGWRERAGAPAGRRPRHLATAAAGAVALGALALGRPRTAAASAAGWAAGSAELAWARLAPGPRTPREIARMVATSAAIPFAASGWWTYGMVRARRLAARPSPPFGRVAAGAPPDAVLFDRDGTLVQDVPYNGDPDRVEPVPGAREALARLRDAGVKLAVVSNQSGVARGLLTRDQVDAVNRRIEELLGPLGPWLVCEHGPHDACECRKPAPGLVLRAAAELAVEPARCAVVGDIGSDVEAARSAGARAILVPNVRTRREEIDAAPERASSLSAAVDLLLEGAR